jgi:hypothetical protein
MEDSDRASYALQVNISMRYKTTISRRDGKN